jgi:Leucine-rich repeat (LRR) protein
VELVELTCENCGGQLSIDLDKGLAICQFCGTVFKMVDDRPIIINQYYDEHPGSKQALRQSVAEMLQQRMASLAEEAKVLDDQQAAKQKSGGLVTAVVLALVIGLGVGGFFLFRHLAGADNDSAADELTGRLIAEEMASASGRALPESDLLLDVAQAAFGTRTPTPDQLASITSLRLSSEFTGGIHVATVEWAVDGGETQRLVVPEETTVDAADFTAFTGLVSLDLTDFSTFDLEQTYYQTLDSLVNLRELRLGPLSWEEGMVPVPEQLEVLEGAWFGDDYALEEVRSMTALRQLSISFGADVTDFSAITDLPALTDVTVNSLSYVDNDFGWLEDIPNLESLTVNAYNLADFSFLNSLTNLRHLSLNGAQNLKTLDVVRRLPQLESLTVDRSVIMTLAPLEGMTSLKSLTLSYNLNLTDVSAVSSLTGLEQLSCDRGYSVSAGFSATGLTRLTTATVPEQFLPWLAGAPLTDLTVVNGLDDPASLLGFTEVTRLRLEGGAVQSLAGLERLGLTRLELDDISLWWDDNGQHIFEIPVAELVVNQVDGLHIGSTEVLANTGLKALTFTNTSPYQQNESKTADYIAPILGQLTGLETLDLSDSGLSSLEFARSLTNLQALTISDTYVSDIAPLKSLASLRTLVCFNCPIVNPGGVSAQVNLVN